MMSLENKIVLVTGASRGIGHAIACALGRKQATVIGTATTQEGAQHITHLLEAQQIKGWGMVLDVSTTDSVEAVMSHIRTNIGSISILVNNAAITQDNLLLRMSDTEWSRVLDTDLYSIYRLSKACIRDMIKARWGRIINIGSVVGSMGNAGQVNYAAAKAGMIGFSKALATEVGSRNITVNTVAPGFIDTDMTKALADQQREAIFQRIPMQRFGQAEEVAAVVVFLASAAAGYITGQTIHVNGGIYMG
jgi:3-oxoacyl-[acyl-carrier protein] reductase